jgi:O-acetyl-ADP-ribose deacetylase
MITFVTSTSFPGNQNLTLCQGDLTEMQVDAIVNAANSELQHEGGVAAAIVRRGGTRIQTESNAWVAKHGPVTHADPAVTNAGTLSCRFVIHAVGPVWGQGDEERKLAQAIAGSLRMAERLNLTSIALPPISTGIFGFPKDRAAPIFYAVIQRFFEQNPDSKLRDVYLTIIDTPTLGAFLRAWQSWKGSVTPAQPSS